MSSDSERSGERMSPVDQFCQDVYNADLFDMLARLRQKSSARQPRRLLGQYLYVISTDNSDLMPVQEYARGFFDGVAFGEEYERRVLGTPSSRDEITRIITAMIRESRIDSAVTHESVFGPLQQGAGLLMQSALTALGRHPGLAKAMQYASIRIADVEAAQRIMTGFGIIVEAIDRYNDARIPSLPATASEGDIDDLISQILRSQDYGDAP